jgi:putative phosphoesterase
MSKLLIVADIHGHYSIWQKVTQLLGPKDTLAVAGDLFDTRYGNYKNRDFMPEQIKEEFIDLNIPKYYVYGNCDDEWFFPGQEYFIKFDFNGKKILLRHGHIKEPLHSDIDIIIEGHSHIKQLEIKGKKIFLNPGSVAIPRDEIASYAIWEGNKIGLLDMENNRQLKSKTLF